MPSTLVGRDAELSLLESELDLAIAGGRRIVLVAGEAGLGKTALRRGVRGRPRASARTRVDVSAGCASRWARPGCRSPRCWACCAPSRSCTGPSAWSSGPAVGGGRSARCCPTCCSPPSRPTTCSCSSSRPSPGSSRVRLPWRRWSCSSRTCTGPTSRAGRCSSSSRAAWARRRCCWCARSGPTRSPVLSCCGRSSPTWSGSRGPCASISRGSVVPRWPACSPALGGPRPTAELVDQIHRRSEGVPFYVEELAMLDRAGTGVPESLRGALEARTSRLDVPARELLGLMAVGGIRVHHELLIEASGAGSAEVDGLLREAVDAGVVRVDGDELAFRHALFGEALYADLLPGERIRHHASVAQTLERRPGLAAGITATTSSRCTGRAPVSTSAPSRRRPVRCAAGRPRTPRPWRCTSGCSSSGTRSRIRRRTAGPRAELLTDAARAARDAGEFDRAIELVSAALEESDDADLTGRVERLMLRSHLVTDDLRAALTPTCSSPRPCSRASRTRRSGRGCSVWSRSSGSTWGSTRCRRPRRRSGAPASRRPTTTAWRTRARPTGTRPGGGGPGRGGTRGATAGREAHCQGSAPGPCCATGSTTPTRST